MDRDDAAGGAGDELAQREEQAAAAEAAAIGGDPGYTEADDPAERPLREAGEGEAEGFEDAERALADHAAHGDLGHSPRHDGFTAEAESDRSGAEYAEADDERVTERQDQP